MVAGRRVIFGLLCSCGGAGSDRSCLSGAGLAGSSVARRRWRLCSLAPRRQLRAEVQPWAKGFIVTLSSFNFT